MEKIYKIVFVYPDGHIEDIDTEFHTGKEALEYGNNLLAQVYNTEGVFRGLSSSGDEFDFQEKKEPHFMILEVRGKKSRLVYDSNLR